MQSTNEKYRDIIELPHPTSKHHTQMASVDRAAQFSPFAALTGHNEVISETARLTDKRIVLSEDKIAELDCKLQMIAERINERPEIKVTFFKEDDLKEGGKYIVKNGAATLIDKEKGRISIEDEIVAFDDIYELLFE